MIAPKDISVIYTFEQVINGPTVKPALSSQKNNLFGNKKQTL